MMPAADSAGQAQAQVHQLTLHSGTQAGNEICFHDLPSDKETCHGKSPFTIGKSTVNRPFSIAMVVYLP